LDIQISVPGVGKSDAAGLATQHLCAFAVFKSADVAREVARTCVGLVNAWNASGDCGGKVGAAIAGLIGDRMVFAAAHNVRTGRASASGMSARFVFAAMAANIAPADIADAVEYGFTDGYGRIADGHREYLAEMGETDDA